jgi:hypothetical protein
MLRRILAITLLIAFGSPLFAPLFAATSDPEASLPACCRSHGTHHCAMMHRESAGDGSPVLQAPPCSSYPSAFIPLRLTTASLADVPQPFAAFHRGFGIIAGPRNASATLAVAANRKRGPPLSA